MAYLSFNLWLLGSYSTTIKPKTYELFFPGVTEQLSLENQSIGRLLVACIQRSAAGERETGGLQEFNCRKAESWLDVDPSLLVVVF